MGACQDCIALMHEALNLTVRGRRLDMVHNRENMLAVSVAPNDFNGLWAWCKP